jgi:hypothetical protein
MLKEVEYISKKKSIHINIEKSQHRMFRSKLFLNELTMQQFISMIISKFNVDDPSILKMIKELKEDLKEKEINKLKGIDEKDLYDAIEKYSPLS